MNFKMFLQTFHCLMYSVILTIQLLLNQCLFHEDNFHFYQVDSQEKNLKVF